MFCMNIRLVLKEECVKIPINNIFIPTISVVIKKQLFIISFNLDLNLSCGIVKF